ncbi:MAG: transcriptional repressor [Candidatus Lokiarchaeota archaeon]|nr:transcriptional repressor [Candidatus Lokiarchaeota archaeon]MBD3201658.1 transcriptional repressor [Candidatus Lokiarchaeota archaeon]
MDDQELYAIFRKNGYKVTSQRLAVYNYLISREDHPSADEIFNALKEEHPTISLGTIYNSLSVLRDLGLIQELGFNEGSSRYDPNTEVHVNMVCEKCGEIHDYYPEFLETLWEKITNSLEITPTGQRIDIYYQCEKCSNQMKE